VVWWCMVWYVRVLCSMMVICGMIYVVLWYDMV
jgi:hypothetical protein